MNRRDNNPRPPSGAEPPEVEHPGDRRPPPLPASLSAWSAETTEPERGGHGELPPAATPKAPMAVSVRAPMAEEIETRVEGPVGVPVAGPIDEVAADVSSDSRLGQTLLGRYRIDKLVGKGGMGRVYRATQIPLSRAVAIKILNPEFQRKDPQFMRRFFLEAATAAQLTHPNTITVFDYGESESGELFIAMEYLEGRPLSRVLATEGPFATVRTLHVAAQICRALREAHAKGIIHRDLKPGNILLMEEGDDSDFVKVLDFGLVKLIDGDVQLDLNPQSVSPPPDSDLTRAGMFLGSPKYMSPEQIQGVSLDPRTDIYSLGVLMYQMATGRPPFIGATSVEVIYKHVNDPPPPFAEAAVEVPPELQAIILRCLAKSRDDRYASMGALLVHLKDAKRLLVPNTVTGESEVDIHLSDLTNSLFLRDGGRSGSGRFDSAVVAPLAPVVARSTSGRELPFSEAPAANDTRSVLDDSPAPSPRTLRLAPWLAGAVFTVVLLAAGAMAWSGVFSGDGAEASATGTPRGEAHNSERGPAKAPRAKLAAPAGVAMPERRPPSATAAGSTAELSLRSRPAGAEVFEDGVRIGRTPLSYEVRWIVGRSRPRTFMFKAPGHRPTVERVAIDKPRIEVSVTLPPIADEPELDDASDADPGRDGADGIAGGYKENPY